MINHKWTFKARLRTGIFPWNGTAKASQRMLEAVSEIKKVAKIDSSLAADGVLELFARIYPACMHIDSSSGALGTAVNKTIETLLPVIITADWDIDTRRKKLEVLYQAVIDDGWNLLHPVEECWGELDIALQCAESGNCDISVLLRATRDFGKSNPEFACKVGIEALTSLLTKEFYDRIEPTDIKIAYGNISTIAKDADIEDWFRQTITQRILNIQPKIKSYLIDSISGLIKSFLR